MRNIISGKAGDRTRIQSGFDKHDEDHKEGDVWEQNGKQWTIKNGIKQTFTKLDAIKKLVVLPISCPKCNNHMKINNLNKKMYSIHNMCFDCVVEMETKIKLEGNWKDYESGILNANKNATLQDFETALNSWMEENDSFVSENGEIENWSKIDKSKIYEKIKSNLDNLKNIKI